MQRFIALIFCNLALIAGTWVHAQDGVQHIFEKAFENPDPHKIFHIFVYHEMGLSNDEMKEVSKISSYYLSEFERISLDPELYAAGKQGEQTLALRREVFNQFSERLNPQQQILLNRHVVQAHIERTLRSEENPGNLALKDANLVLAKELTRALGISDVQENRLKELSKEFSKLLEDHSRETEDSIQDTYRRWQQALFEELLPFQQREYKTAVGEKCEALGELHILPFYYEKRGLRLDRTRSGMNYTIEPPEGIHMLVLTPFYVDAPMHPHGMFALILHDVGVKELGITVEQKKQLEVLKEEWSLVNPLPSRLRISPEFGTNMTSKKQREEAANARKEHGEIEDKVFAVLKDKQVIRLRQIWNQIMLSMGWEDVNLALPDWRSYLELTDDQNAAFDRVHEQFKNELEKLETESSNQQKQIVSDHRTEVGKVLTDSQKDRMQKWLGVKFQN